MTTRYKSIDGDSWLREGRIYAVQSIYVSADEGVQYRILGEEPNTPALFAAGDFEIIDATMPPTWIVFDLGSRNFVIGPADWTSPGYWELYFEGDQEARQKFETHCTRLDPC